MNSVITTLLEAVLIFIIILNVPSLMRIMEKSLKNPTRINAGKAATVCLGLLIFNTYTMVKNWDYLLPTKLADTPFVGEFELHSLLRAQDVEKAGLSFWRDRDEAWKRCSSFVFPSGMVPRGFDPDSQLQYEFYFTLPEALPYKGYEMDVRIPARNVFFVPDSLADRPMVTFDFGGLELKRILWKEVNYETLLNSGVIRRAVIHVHPTLLLNTWGIL